MTQGEGVAVEGRGSMTLTEFLLARIDEDQTKVRAILESLETPPSQPVWEWSGSRFIYGTDCPFWFPTDWTPARVLAECEAKRRIVEHAETVSGMDYQIEAEWGPRGYSVPEDEDEGVRLLRMLASVYADHPDYDEAWRP